MIVYANTDVGKKRSSNQDNYKYAKISDNCLWTIVCDGMGGVAGGNIASEITVQKAEEILCGKFNENLSDSEIESLGKIVIEEANKTIFQKGLDDETISGMGTTAVLILIANMKMHVFHVGDSRAYLKRNNEIKQITVDHSFVQNLVEQGEITPEEARTHPRRNIITRSVGVHEMVEVDYQNLEICDKDLIMSCSDGLSNYADDGKLNELLEKPVDSVVDELINFALESGGSDNITVAVIEV